MKVAAITGERQCELADKPDPKAIDRHSAKLQKMADLYCTGCGYCIPCPNEVNIPRIFNFYNQARVYGLWDHAKMLYRNLCRSAPKGGMPANACTECGECEEKGPQDIPIRKQLKEAHEALTPENNKSSLSP